MKTVIAVLMFTLTTSSPALAQVDTDQFSVCFDPAGTQTSLDMAPGFLTAYLVLLNPTLEAAEITGWEAGCWTFHEMGPDLFPLGPSFQIIFTPAGAVSATPGNCGMSSWAGGGPWTLPAGPAVVLGTLEVFVPNDRPHGFYEDQGWGGLYRDGAPDILLTPATPALSTLPPPLWLPATVNSDHVPVPDENLGWGAVKALYR